MTAKKKQKQKKILLQRGVSVSSSSSDDDDDEDENAVIKDEKNSSERRKEKNWKRNVGLDAPIQKERRKRRTLAEFVRLRRDVDEEGGEQEQRFDGRKRRRKYVDVPRGESAESEGHEDAEEREDGFGQGD
jgi:hypothetical protein